MKELASLTAADIARALNRALLARIESGEATAAEMNVAASILRNNGVISLPEDTEVEALRSKVMESLPFKDTDEQHERFN